MKLGKVIIVPVVLVSLFGLASVASAGGNPVPSGTAYVLPPTTCAYVEGSIDCSVERPKGVKRVWAVMQTGVGPVLVLDESYRGCPTTVEFTLDPIVLDYPTNIVVESCEQSGISGERDSGSFKASSGFSRPVVVGGLVNPR